MSEAGGPAVPMVQLIAQRPPMRSGPKRWLDAKVMRSAPFVVAVSGTSGAGKSTLVRGLTEAWRAANTVAVSVMFDDFAAVSDLPEADLSGWLARGGDPDEWRTDQMAQELRRLKLDSQAQAATAECGVELVFIEEPFGRARGSIGPMVDLGLHIHLPLNVALARRLVRDLVPSAGAMDPSATEELRSYLMTYLKHGAAAYQLIDALAAAAADVVLDGLLDPGQLLQQSVEEVAVRRAR